MNTGAFVIIEALDFTSAIKDHFGDEATYAELKHDLATEPEKGGVIPGAWPLREIRWSDKRRIVPRKRGAGKTGLLRVVYIHIPEIQVIYLLDVYGKDEGELLYAQEKRAFKDLAKQLMHDLIQKHLGRA